LPVRQHCAPSSHEPQICLPKNAARSGSSIKRHIEHSNSPRGEKELPGKGPRAECLAYIERKPWRVCFENDVATSLHWTTSPIS
jgi:hypothetical protein